jgi:NAD-dependent DNA ligase
MDKPGLNSEGQPSNPNLNLKRVREREQYELTGLLKGLLCDGPLSARKAEFLYGWINLHRHSSTEWPYSKIHDELHAASHDGFGSRDELARINTLINETINGGKAVPQLADHTTSLPIDKEIVSVTISGKSFCFTGKLKWGTRNKAQKLVEEKGGYVSFDVTVNLDYLVLGDLGSRDWRYSTHGEKIKSALSLKERGKGIKIIPESVYLKALGL